MRATTEQEGLYEFAIAGSEFDKRLNPKYLQIIAVGKGHGLDWAARGDGDDITLRLVKDDTVIKGRVVDLEGTAIPRASIRVIEVKSGEDEDLRSFAKSLKSARDARPLENKFLSKSVPSNFLHQQFPPFETDMDGRFVLKGMGDQRM